MNEQNVKAAIAVMERVRDKGYKLEALNWRHIYVPPYPVTTKQMLGSGEGFNFTEWLSVSPEFKRLGWSTNYQGIAEFGGGLAQEAIQNFLEISYELAKDLTSTNDCGAFQHRDHEFYGVLFYDDITPQMVIDKLNLILKGELV